MVIVSTLQKDQQQVADVLRTKTTQLEDQYKHEKELKTRCVLSSIGINLISPPLPPPLFLHSSLSPSLFYFLPSPHRLKEFAQVYELVKTERNKIYAQIQNHHQVEWALMCT